MDIRLNLYRLWFLIIAWFEWIKSNWLKLDSFHFLPALPLFSSLVSTLGTLGLTPTPRINPRGSKVDLWHANFLFKSRSLLDKSWSKLIIFSYMCHVDSKLFMKDLNSSTLSPALNLMSYWLIVAVEALTLQFVQSHERYVNAYIKRDTGFWCNLAKLCPHLQTR